MTPALIHGTRDSEVPSMLSTSESQSRYLSLAVASREVIAALRGYQQGGPLDQSLRKALRSLIDALNESREETNLFGPMPTDSPFTRYEQVMTLREVIEDFKDKKIVEKLSAVLEKPHEDVKEPIEFFYILENRALHHYNSGLLSRDS